MAKFQVSANGTVFGVYGETQQDARNACAVDAGYAHSDTDTPADLGLSATSDADAIEEVKKLVTTGHEIEMAELERQAASPERRALVIKLAGEGLAEAGEVLRLAALGQLAPVAENIFGEPESVADQVAMAELTIERHLESLRAI